jgi:hypothetical protein
MVTASPAASSAYPDSGINQQLAGRPVRADGGYQVKPEVITQFREPGDGQELVTWKAELSNSHKRARARVEHSLSRLTTWKIPRDYRRASSTLEHTAPANAPHSSALGH